LPLELEFWYDIVDYIDSFPGVNIYYMQSEMKLVVLAGRVAWSHTYDNEREIESLAKWLADKGAKYVKGWRELQELFV